MVTTTNMSRQFGESGVAVETSSKMPVSIENGSSSSSTDEHERRFMNFLNFTEDMYKVLVKDEDELAVSSPCMDSMYEVGQSYRMVHGYISLLVCVAGILMNILIIMVLTRKEMCTPINRMLTALAIADMLVMIEYIPFTIHMYIFALPEQEQYSYSWAMFVLFHSHFTQILHTINIQLTISMSIWRYLALKCSTKNSTLLTMKKCRICILAAYICPIIICIPNYLTFSIYHREKLILQPPFDAVLNIREVDAANKQNIIQLCMQTSEIMNIPMDCKNVLIKHDWYTVGLSEMATANNELLHAINFWIYSVLVKLIPCVVLTFFMCWLVNTLYKAKRRHKMLKRNSGVPLATVAGSCSSGNSERNRNNNRRQSKQRSTSIIGNSPAERETTVPIIMDDESLLESGTLIRQVQQHGQTLGASSSLTSSAMTLVPNGNGVSRGHAEHDFGTDDEANRRESTVSFGCPPTSTRALSSSSSSSSSKYRKNSTISTTPKNKRKRRFFPCLLDRVQQEQDSQRRCSEVSTFNHPQESVKNRSRHSTKKTGKRPDRTSKLLIAVLFLFLLTEFPQGIMAFLSGIYGEQFFRKCYNTWAEVWDILALINSAINFILYCFMSKQFRLQFHLLFRLGNLFGHGTNNDKCPITNGNKCNTIVTRPSLVPTIV